MLGIAVFLGLLVPPPTSANEVLIETSTIDLGSRPEALIQQMGEGELKRVLSTCAKEITQFRSTPFSIGHRGAPLKYPEHTVESYTAAAAMGAGIVECDVTFTKDKALVCRHSQCDLHSTTNIVATPLAKMCSVPPIVEGDGTLRNASKIRCCTSDITVAEFQTLEGKKDAFDPLAKTLQDYLAETKESNSIYPNDSYAGATRGTLMTHSESIALLSALGVGMTPELKSPQVSMPFHGGYTQQKFAQQMIDEYRAANVDPSHVWPQSFNYDDVLYWVRKNPDFGKQVVYLDNRYEIEVGDATAVAAMTPSFTQLVSDGVTTVAPPIFMLLQEKGNAIVPSAYALAAKDAGLNLISWTTERSGKLRPGGGGFYYQSVKRQIKNDGDIFTVMDVLAQEVGIIGLFSDWPATTTFYANCLGE